MGRKGSTATRNGGGHKPYYRLQHRQRPAQGPHADHGLTAITNCHGPRQNSLTPPHTGARWRGRICAARSSAACACMCPQAMAACQWSWLPHRSFPHWFRCFSMPDGSCDKTHVTTAAPPPTTTTHTPTYPYAVNNGTPLPQLCRPAVTHAPRRWGPSLPHRAAGATAATAPARTHTLGRSHC